MADTSSALIERAASAAAVQAARDAAACRALGGPLTIVGEAHGTPASVPLSDGAGDEIVARMAQVASDDHDYRVQLTELAARRGGLYAHALASLFDVERDTLGVEEAERRRKLDQDLLDETKRKDLRNAQLQMRAWLASEIVSGAKPKEQAVEEWNQFLAALRSDDSEAEPSMLVEA